MELFDMVYLREDISSPPLRKGMAGTIIHIYKPDRLFEVEFLNSRGDTIAVITAEKIQISLLNEQEIYEEIWYKKKNY
jgi:hypothetical protein